MYEIKRNNEAQLKVRGKPSWLINRYKKAQKRHLKSRYLLSTKGTNAGFTMIKKASISLHPSSRRNAYMIYIGAHKGEAKKDICPPQF